MKVKQVLLGLLLFIFGTVYGARSQAAQSLTLDDIGTDAKLYFTAPIRWDMRDWLYFGGAVAAIAAAHQYDGNVRRHFEGPNPVLNGGKDPNSLRDAAPAAALMVGTWAFAWLVDDQSGRVEAYTMLEAAAFSSITAEGLKYVAGRARPNQSLRVDDWRSGGSSFPSLHSTAAFAIGTVLAESGSDEFRWLRRVIGYGVAGFTAYRRLHDNEHWLSDTVAGAAIGASTARFTLNRRDEREHPLDVSVTSNDGGGVSLRFNYVFH